MCSLLLHTTVYSSLQYAGLQGVNLIKIVRKLLENVILGGEKQKDMSDDGSLKLLLIQAEHIKRILGATNLEQFGHKWHEALHVD